MKKFTVIPLCLVLLLPGAITMAEIVPVRFKAEVKTAEDAVVPRAYLRVWQPGVTAAVDSMFFDEEGKLDAELPFSFESTTSISQPARETGYITREIHPNVLGRDQGMLSLDYGYPSDAELYFLDIQGRIHGNHSDLLPGMYYYFIRFGDGNRSELHKIIVAEPVRVNVTLSYSAQKKSGSGGFDLAGTEYETFIAEIVRDGYVTLTDTLAIDSAVVEKTFRMEEAPAPSAEFSYTGSLVAGEPVVFNASASAGANGEELAYHWNFGDGNLGGTPVLPHLFTTAGDYDITLTVRGDYGAVHSLARTLSIEPAGTPPGYTGLVNGYITDENQDPVGNAKVSLVGGDAWTTSNSGGIATLDGLPLGVPVHFRITKEGCVDQVVELSVPEESGEAVFFSTLKNREPAVTLKNAEFGGEVGGPDGTGLSLPVMPFVKPDGSEVTGDVQVSITPVDVAFEAASFPGSFTGYDETGEEGVLLSYGVSEFHFEQNGEALQLAEGKKAVITIPIYTGGAAIGQEIPLWSVNEDNGRWVREGTGTVVASANSLTGLALRAGVNHFSWFNCDDFDDDRKKKGLCYIWDCTSAICVKLKVGCWVHGARRESAGGKKAELQEGRDTIAPVFEVRDFLPEEGRELLMPTSSNVYMEARGFTGQGQLMRGEYTMLTDYAPDTFGIELTPVVASDTVDLALNTIREDYLQPGEFLPFRLDIPVTKEYHLIFDRGEEGTLWAAYTFTDENGILASGEINQDNNLITLYPGEVILNIYGYTQADEGSFVLAVAEPGVFLPGDTTAIETGTLYEETLGPAAFRHFTLSLSGKKPLKIQVGYGSSPTLSGRYRVLANRKELHEHTIDNQPFYCFPEAGPLCISVAGRILTDEGNFTLRVDTVGIVPLALNDSIDDSLTVSLPDRMYSLESDHHTVVRARFYTTGGEDGYGTVKLWNASGKILDTEYLYEQEKLVVPCMHKDSVYLLQVGGPAMCRYRIITTEEETAAMDYGDTVRTRLRYKKEKDLYRFGGEAGDLVSIRGIQPDNVLTKGSFALITPYGKELGRRGIWRATYSYDKEIIYRLPEDGEYYILVESMDNDTGSYELSLDTISSIGLSPNSLTDIEVTTGKDTYLEFLVPEDQICHLSVVGEGATGMMDIFSGDCERMNERNSSRYYSSYFGPAYTNRLKAGSYYLKLTNNSSGTAHVNYAVPQLLQLDGRGESTFRDTIHEARKVNAWYIRGRINNGVHGVMKVDGELPAPSKPELKCYPCSSDGTVLNLKYRGQTSYSLDSAFLYESGGKLDGAPDDSTWVLVGYALSEGIYEFNFHQVTSSAEIRVDDDYSEYPGAQTSSPVAAGYAVKESGSILIANGEYASCLPVNIETDGIRVRGQERNGTWLQNVYGLSDNPVIYMQGDGGRIEDLSLSGGRTSYEVIKFSGDGINMQHLWVRPLPGSSTLGGGIKGSGDDIHIDGVSLDSTLWGIDVASPGGIVENCEILSDDRAIRLIGINTAVRNNTLTIKSSGLAISSEFNSLEDGSQVVENNEITMESGTSTSGVIHMEHAGGPEVYGTGYVRNNVIHSSGASTALSAEIGNPPSAIVMEGNRFYCTHPWGGQALNLWAAYTSGASDIVVRNNVFEGLSSNYVIRTSSTDLVADSCQWGIYNNSFRMAETAQQDTAHYFMNFVTFYTEVKDTVPVYVVNNIFYGNGYSCFARFEKDFSIYADYNTVYNFRRYILGVGRIIGTTNDIPDDPLYLDGDLHLDPDSPAIDRGATPLQFEFIPGTDIDGIARPRGPGYDMGAYENERADR